MKTRLWVLLVEIHTCDYAPPKKTAYTWSESGSWTQIFSHRRPLAEARSGSDCFWSRVSEPIINRTIISWHQSAGRSNLSFFLSNHFEERALWSSPCFVRWCCCFFVWFFSSSLYFPFVCFVQISPQMCVYLFLMSPPPTLSHSSIWDVWCEHAGALWMQLQN